ncbi:MAG: hypothetical protein Kapaf2KO_07190 [Candidatus Kapaibacteriales bacterium]
MLANTIKSYLLTVLSLFIFSLEATSRTGIDDLPRAQIGINISSMIGPGLGVQLDLSRKISLGISAGGYYTDFEGNPELTSSQRDLIPDDTYQIYGAELQYAITRSDTEKFFSFYSFSYWEYSEIRDFSYQIINDEFLPEYEERLGIARNHSIGVGYEWIARSIQAYFRVQAGYQFQFSNRSDYGWLLDRSPDGTINHGIGIGISFGYAFDFE